ncbi:MAG: hypothetical protein JW717_10090 [Marinilabiliaceae bacterium]|nr:hypothetical protein [Marinilabiliaceae bacterium]
MKENAYKKINARLRKAVLVLGAVLLTSGLWAQTTPWAKYSFNNSASDSQGNLSDATLFGEPSYGLSYDSVDIGLTLDGVDDYAVLPEGFMSGLTDFTFASWVYWTDRGNYWWERIWDFGADTNHYIFLTPRGGTVRVAFKNGGDEEQINATSELPSNQWVHIAVTLQGTTGILYLNGIEAGRNTITIRPADLGTTTANYIGDSQYTSDQFFGGSIDEFEIFNSALTPTEILSRWSTYPKALTDEYSALDLGDLSDVKTNISLPTVLGTNGVTASWTSSIPSVISNTGEVTIPEFDQTITLTAKIGFEGDTLYKSFVATVLALGEVDVLASWSFESDNISIVDGVVKANSEYGDFTASMMNDAKIITIGNEGNQFNVVDLQAGTGYVDLGEAIGEYMYKLSSYTMSIFFRLDDDAPAFPTHGNFIWTFSNTNDMANNAIGGLYMVLNGCIQEVCKTRYDNAQSVRSGVVPTIGTWHHLAYTQDGTTGTVYLDGAAIKTGTVTYTPSSTFPIDSLLGTAFNWLGKPCYTSDSYLQNTLLYGFQLWGYGLGADEVSMLATDGYGGTFSGRLDSLNSAFAANPNNIDTDVQSVLDALDLGDLSNVTGNVSLPTSNASYPDVTISWTVDKPSIITAEGSFVARPNTFNQEVTFTATVSKGITILTKKFVAIVPPADGTQYTSDLMVHFDFSNVDENGTVTDLSEKQYKGKVMNNASIKLIGTEGASDVYKVLDLGDSIGYFDMGTDMGPVLPHLSDYTITAYYCIDTSYESLESDNGNFIWSLSNTDDALNNANGYIIGMLKLNGISITGGNYSTAAGIDLATNALYDGRWHCLTYTQQDTLGTVYVDGYFALSGKVVLTPDSALKKPGLMGTSYNWIGKPCYKADSYLRKTKVYDFRIYNRALTEDEIGATGDLLDVPNRITSLNMALDNTTQDSTVYADVETNALVAKYNVISGKGNIQVSNTNGKTVSVFDMTGIKVYEGKAEEPVTLNTGLYFVKVEDVITKVIVK